MLAQFISTLGFGGRFASLLSFVGLSHFSAFAVQTPSSAKPRRRARSATWTYELNTTHSWAEKYKSTVEKHLKGRVHTVGGLVLRSSPLLERWYQSLSLTLRRFDLLLLCIVEKEKKTWKIFSAKSSKTKFKLCWMTSSEPLSCSGIYFQTVLLIGQSDNCWDHRKICRTFIFTEVRRCSQGPQLDLKVKVTLVACVLPAKGEPSVKQQSNGPIFTPNSLILFFYSAL